MAPANLGEPTRVSEDVMMMSQALFLAGRAAELGEVPVGAVISRNGRIVSQAYNLRETLNDPTAHAERIALTLAGRALGTWKLENCTLHVTLEPCAMCAGAIGQSRIQRLVYAASDLRAGACRSLYRILDDPRLGYRVEVTTGVLAAESAALLLGFFQKMRSSSTNRSRRGD